MMTSLLFFQQASDVILPSSEVVQILIFFTWELKCFSKIVFFKWQVIGITHPDVPYSA